MPPISDPASRRRRQTSGNADSGDGAGIVLAGQPMQQVARAADCRAACRLDGDDQRPSQRMVFGIGGKDEVTRHMAGLERFGADAQPFGKEQPLLAPTLFLG